MSRRMKWIVAVGVMLVAGGTATALALHGFVDCGAGSCRVVCPLTGEPIDCEECPLRNDAPAAE